MRTAILHAAAAAVVLPSVSAALRSVDPGWQTIPMVSAAIRANGVQGGEGCQVVRDVVISNDGALFLAGTDVGGLYRSLDGGANWHIAMVGYWSRGAASFAIDPVNSSRAFAIATNTNQNNNNGIYMSEDTAASWTQILPLSDSPGFLEGPVLVFDPSSCSTSGAAGGTGCLTAYFSSTGSGLYTSKDGGYTWTVVNANMSNCVLAVDSSGLLFAASNDYRNYGLYRSSDGGHTFTVLRDEYTLGLTIPVHSALRSGSSGTAGNDTVYISNWAGVAYSTDTGHSWSFVAGIGLPHGTPMHRIAVSPVNTSIMTLHYYEGADWNSTRMYSHDGGAHWQATSFDNSLAFMPYNGRQSVPAMHPLDATVVWSSGADWFTKSVDGGATAAWAANGYSGVMVGSSFTFNPSNPNVTFLAFQDYGGALTLDGGFTFSWMNIANQSWGAFTYAGGSLSAQVHFTGNAPSWGGPRQLTVTKDGGATWVGLTNSSGGAVIYEGGDVSFIHPTNPSIAFASNWRTSDGGSTWVDMRPTGASVVYTYNAGLQAPATQLFGADSAARTIVTSTDGGASWITLIGASQVPAWPLADLAYDYQAAALYIVANDALYRCNNTSGSSWACGAVSTPPDQHGSSRLKSVAVDPVKPQIVYASNTKDVYAADNSVIRSVDGGATWQVLLLDTPLSPTPNAPLQGPHEVSWVRVHPTTRWLWAAGECFGVWTAPPPL